MSQPVAAQSRAPAETRSIALELYVDSASKEGDVQTWVEAAARKQPGVGLRIYDVSSADGGGKERFAKICKHFRLKSDESIPLLYGFGKAVVAPDAQSALEQKVAELRTMTVYVRSGCPRCAAAKEYLKKLQAKYPGIALNYRDVATDRTAQTEMDQVARQFNQRAASVPMFYFCNQIVVGWSSESATGRRLESILGQWTFAPGKSSNGSRSQVHPPAGNEPTSIASLAVWFLNVAGNRSRQRFASCGPGFALLAGVALLAQPDHRERDPPDESESATPQTDAPAEAESPPPELPLPGDSFDSLPLPGDVSDDLPLPVEVTDSESGSYSPPPKDAMDIPVFGRVRASDMGMPAFTLAVGLVDGFNPCAMWVLLFLLSVLVNLQSRWKILAVAGSFVVVSGAAYFAFMAAWLNVITLFASYLKHVYIALGVLALFIGAVHIKDFFAFKQGISFSIPESAKPGIYARIRRIVTAENLVGAVIGAVILAVLVNIIELLCTAGLPALYTGVLSLQKYPAWKEYAYLGLYNAAYMADDTLMVAIVVITLGRKKLQEQQGRWLKLVSGLAVFLLGIIMLVKPELLTEI